MTSASSESPYTITGLLSNTTYYFHIRALSSTDPTNKSQWSNVLSIDTTGDGTTGGGNSLSKPIPIISSNTADSITLTWSDSNTSDVTFEIEYSLDSGLNMDGDFQNQEGSSSAGFGDTEITITGLSSNTTYYFHIRALSSTDSTNKSAWSDTVNRTTGSSGSGTNPTDTGSSSNNTGTKYYLTSFNYNWTTKIETPWNDGNNDMKDVNP